MKPAAILLPLLLAGAPALAAEHVVEMLNRGEAGAMVFEPALILAEVGDTVRFVATDRGHNAETIEGFIPEGVDPVIGEIDEEIVIEVTAEGLYGIRCKPHFGLGMVALIAAGDAEEAAIPEGIRMPRKAEEIFTGLLEARAEAAAD